MQKQNVPLRKSGSGRASSATVAVRYRFTCPSPAVPSDVSLDSTVIVSLGGVTTRSAAQVDRMRMGQLAD